MFAPKLLCRLLTLPKGPLRNGLVLVALATTLSACGEPEVVCPKGYEVKGEFCYPIVEPEPDAAVTPDVQDGESDAAATDASGPATDAGKPDTGTDAAAGTDIVFPEVKDTNSGKSPVGAACADEFDCLGGLTCHNWPKGYCSIITCKSAGTTCPGSSVCYGESSGAEICHAVCDFDSDCRVKDGYACKRYTADFGGIDARLCTPSGPNPIGLGCKKPSDCAGSATCLTDMAGGYCARIGCGVADACDAGSACVLRNGKPMCLKTCTADVECQIATKEARKCVDRTDLTKKPVKICSDSAKSAPVGSSCLADLDCDSKFCSIYAKGTCAVGGQPCLNDGQCGAAGPCNLSPADEKGLCSQPCDVTKKCPINSICIPVEGGTTGSCSAVCKGPGDDTTCAIPGTECIFGQPLTPAGTATVQAYGCAPLPAGSSGSSCTSGSECAKGGICFDNGQGTGGFCANPCTAEGACPYGSSCGDVGVNVCLKLCSSDFDCPPAMVCKNSGQVTGKVCTQQ
jgi:hypothetical protein